MMPLIMEMARAEKELEDNFKVGDRTYLVRCPKCKKENYALMVSSGICAWCGYDANEEEDGHRVSKKANK